MIIELTVICKGHDRTQKQKFLCYENISISRDDPDLKKFITEAIQSFGEQPEDLILNFKCTGV